MIAAEINNATFAIVRTLNVPDDFVAPPHKYGLDKPTRIVPVVEGVLPEYDPATHRLERLRTVEQARVLVHWQVVSIPIPDEVPNWALEEELSNRNLIDGLNAAINAMPAGAPRSRARARWNKKPTIKRTDPLVSALAQALSLTSATVDEIFTAASKRT